MPPSYFTFHQHISNDNRWYDLCEVDTKIHNRINTILEYVSLVAHVMACCLFGTEPLPEPDPAYCKLELYEQSSVKFESKHGYLLKKLYLKKRLRDISIILSRPQSISGENIESSRLWGEDLTSILLIEIVHPNRHVFNFYNWCHFYCHGSTVTLIWISNYSQNLVWDEITNFQSLGMDK